MIEKGDYQLKPQADTAATHAPKIFNETCEVDFNQTTQDVHNFIRGLSPYPTAWTTLESLKLKIFKAEKEIPPPFRLDRDFVPQQYKAGKMLTDNKNFIKIATQDGFIHLLDIQLEGRKRMNVKDFLNGYKISTVH